jgi:hypothetical protein
MLGFRAGRKMSDEYNAPVFPEVFEAVDWIISSGLPVGNVATELGLNVQRPGPRGHGLSLGESGLEPSVPP